MKFVKLVFEEHICRINHKETLITLSATSRIWRKSSQALYLPRMTSPEVAIALYFLPNRGLSQSERGKISIHVIIENEFQILENEVQIFESEFQIQ